MFFKIVLQGQRVTRLEVVSKVLLLVGNQNQADLAFVGGLRVPKLEAQFAQVQCPVEFVVFFSTQLVSRSDVSVKLC